MKGGNNLGQSHNNNIRILEPRENTDLQRMFPRLRPSSFLPSSSLGQYHNTDIGNSKDQRSIDYARIHPPIDLRQDLFLMGAGEHARFSVSGRARGVHT